MKSLQIIDFAGDWVRLEGGRGGTTTIQTSPTLPQLDVHGLAELVHWANARINEVLTTRNTHHCGTTCSEHHQYDSSCLLQSDPLKFMPR